MGKLVKEEKEVKLNNFFLILKLENLDYKNIYCTMKSLQKDSQYNLDSLSLQRELSKNHFNQGKLVKSLNSNSLSVALKNIKSFSTNKIERNSSDEKKTLISRNCSLILEKRFLEDENTKNFFGSPENNSSTSEKDQNKPDINKMKSEKNPISVKTKKRKVNSNGNVNSKQNHSVRTKELFATLTLKKFFCEDKDQVGENTNNSSPKNKSNKKLINLPNSNQRINEKKLKSKLINFSQNFQKKVKKKNKSFLGLVFSKFLNTKQKVEKSPNNEQFEANSNLADISLEENEDEDEEGLGKPGKIPHLQGIFSFIVFHLNRYLLAACIHL